MLQISNNVSLSDNEFEFTAVRSQGAGGQNVNKVSSAIHLRFDIAASSLPDFYKNRLLKLKDNRINKQGIVVIKAQEYRTQEKNRAAALERLQELIRSVAVVQKNVFQQNQLAHQKINVWMIRQKKEEINSYDERLSIQINYGYS